MIVLTIISLILNVVSLFFIRTLWVRVNMQDAINKGIASCIKEKIVKSDPSNTNPYYAGDMLL